MGKHAKKKKINKKKIILLFIIVLLIIIIGNIIINNNKTNNMTAKVKHTINTTFKALKEGNIQESNKYVNYDSLMSILDKEILSEENLLKYELNKELFNSLEWNIQQIDVQKDDIKATIEVKNKDYSQIILKWIEFIVKEEENGKTLTNEQCTEKIKEAILNNEIEITTEIRKITLKNTNEKLQIIVDDELGNALFSGIEKIDEALSKIEEE